MPEQNDSGISGITLRQMNLLSLSLIRLTSDILILVIMHTDSNNKENTLHQAPSTLTRNPNTDRRPIASSPKTDRKTTSRIALYSGRL